MTRIDSHFIADFYILFWDNCEGSYHEIISRISPRVFSIFQSDRINDEKIRYEKYIKNKSITVQNFCYDIAGSARRSQIKLNLLIATTLPSAILHKHAIVIEINNIWKIHRTSCFEAWPSSQNQVFFATSN